MPAKGYPLSDWACSASGGSIRFVDSVVVILLILLLHAELVSREGAVLSQITSVAKERLKTMRICEA
ncbi:hypothetical protein M378DRAFT_159424 [Amanita muscaria Koide BX008]|uniref:Uncharacterized protein n=1 Tax=Amanita muscaria (strain Koide BX008) TaxID=946122 RepID=A0A0C2X0J4_AMAMK|nr:hypothetical protein M378DRAFT_159424 [Amanita muscaria Koide BX008]